MIPESVIHNVHRGPLSSDLERALREAILGGHLKPGDRIIEEDIAVQFHVSRGPVREALSKLEQDGLVSRVRHRGTFVKALSHRDVREIYTLLALLEGDAAARAVEHLTESDFIALEGIVGQFGRAVATYDIDQILRLDRSFHGIVIHASDHQLLEQTCRKLDGVMAACFLTISTTVPGRMLLMAERHQRLIDALRAGLAEKTRSEFSKHYLDSLQEMINVWEADSVETADETAERLRVV